MLCWFSDSAAARRAPSTRSSTRRKWARALVKDLHYRLDVNTLHRDETADVARRSTRSAGCTLRTTAPLFFDEYRRNRDHRHRSSSSTRPPTTPSAPGMIL